MMLTIRNLTVAVEGRRILDGLDLDIAAGEVHALMGPNGAGKSTLANVLAGREGYEVLEGEALLDGQDLLTMEPEARAQAGLFLSFQHPVEIPGVSNLQFLRTALDCLRKARGEAPLDSAALLRAAREAAQLLGLPADFLKRGVNEGFSGGEKKRNEILQMLLLEPRFVILDEPDSGLDVDALKLVAAGVNRLRRPDRAFLIITHYPRILEYVRPDRVHVLHGGRIARSGAAELAHQIEAGGYAAVLEGSVA
jgi:Fe-S cluster assembly ATP-binding protein